MNVVYKNYYRKNLRKLRGREVGRGEKTQVTEAIHRATKNKN